MTCSRGYRIIKSNADASGTAAVPGARRGMVRNQSSMIHSRSFRGGESERTNSRRRATGEQISRLRGERGKTMRREIEGLPGGRERRPSCVKDQGFEVRRLPAVRLDFHPLSSLICRYRLKSWPQHPECQVATWRCLIRTALSSLVQQ